MADRESPRARGPWKAALLSLALPGLGHLYDGRPRQAIVAYLAIIVGAVAVVMSIGHRPALISVAALPMLGLLTYLAVPVHAALVARRVPKEYVLAPYNRWYVYVSIYLVFGVGVQEAAAPLIRAYRGETFQVPTGAMEPTLLMGDLIFVIDDFDYIQQDGVFVMWSESDNLSLIKRVVGFPEDTLSMVDGTLMRNGEILEEYVYADRHQDGYMPTDSLRAWQLPHFVGTTTADYRPNMANWGPLVVPSDSVFVLGDNLGNSHDSRARGFVPLASVWGQPTTIYFSYDPFSHKPLPFLTAIRWGRIGHRLDQPGMR